MKQAAAEIHPHRPTPSHPARAVRQPAEPCAGHPPVAWALPSMSCPANPPWVGCKQERWPWLVSSPYSMRTNACTLGGISSTRSYALCLLKPPVKENDTLSIKNLAAELLLGYRSHLDVLLTNSSSFASPNPLYLWIS